MNVNEEEPEEERGEMFTSYRGGAGRVLEEKRWRVIVEKAGTNVGNTGAFGLIVRRGNDVTDGAVNC